jgi:hypothetical protein
MPSITGNIRGQRTQSSCNGYKTIGSSIASGNNSGCFKRVFIDALIKANGNYELAFTKTLGISKKYYMNTSNSINYQQPTLSGKRMGILSNSNTTSLNQNYPGTSVTSVTPGTSVTPVPPPSSGINQSNVISVSDLSVPSIDANDTNANTPFYEGQFYVYNGFLDSYNYSMPTQYITSPPSYLVIQSGSSTTPLILRITFTNVNIPYNFGNIPVIINANGQISLNFDQTDPYPSKAFYIIDTSDSTNPGDINPTTLPSNQNYINLIKTIFPAGLYFNVPINT